MSQDFQKNGHLRPIEIYLTDISLEKTIHEILHDGTIGKREKRKRLRTLQNQFSDLHLRSHVQYYLDSLQPRFTVTMLNLLALGAVVLFTFYTAVRLSYVLRS